MDGMVHLGDGCRIGGGALQKAAVPAHHLVAVVAGNALKSGVAVDQRIVRSGCIRDDDAVAGGSDGAVAQA
jgi:hypothetical protein